CKCAAASRFDPQQHHRGAAAAVPAAPHRRHPRQAGAARTTRQLRWRTRRRAESAQPDGDGGPLSTARIYPTGGPPRPPLKHIKHAKSTGNRGKREEKSTQYPFFSPARRGVISQTYVTPVTSESTPRG